MPSIFGSRKSPRSSHTSSSPTSNKSSSEHTTPTKQSSAANNGEQNGTAPSLLSRSVPTISISTPDSKYRGSIDPVAANGSPQQTTIRSNKAPAREDSGSWASNATGSGSSGDSSPEHESQAPSLATGSTSTSVESLESVQEAHNAKAIAAVAAMHQGKFGGPDAIYKDKSLSNAAVAYALQQQPPSSFDSSSDGTSLLHAEFGFCANSDYRHTSQHRSEDLLPNPVEEEPPYTTVLTTYISYLILIIIGHVRDFFGKKFFPKAYAHLMEVDGYAPLNSDFDSFYTRNLKRRLDDYFSRPVTGVCGRTVMTLDRVSHDQNHNFELTGGKTRALNVSAYNYLGFAQSHGGCSDAVRESLALYGISSFGSRLGGGYLDLQQQAEKLVARFVGQEDAVIISMGFATNSTTIPAITGPGTLIISDEYNHSSIRFGARLRGASIRQYKHNDMRKLELLLRECISQGMPRTHRPWKKILIIVEGLYSMEGTLVNLPALMKLKQKYKVRNRQNVSMLPLSDPFSLQFHLYVDEAHSIGAIGPNGRGVCDYFGINPRDVDILMGTFTKSFGAAGGYIAGSKAAIDRVRLTNHANIYGETLSPPVLTQIIASMASIMGIGRNPSEHALIPRWISLSPRMLDGSEGQERLQRLAFNARYLSSGLRKLGFIVYGHRDSPIVPLLIFQPGKMGMFSRFMLNRSESLPPSQRRFKVLEEEKLDEEEKKQLAAIHDPSSPHCDSPESRPPIVVVVVAYPATALVSARVRYCVSAAHTKADMDAVLRATDEVGGLIGLRNASGGPGGRWTIDQVIDRSLELVAWDGITPI